MTDERSATPVIRVGISSCLLGQKVRYDGGDRHDPVLVAELGKHLEFVPVCPEVEVGMGVPRECVRLEDSPRRPRMVGVESGMDWTARMREFAAAKVKVLARLGIRGFILKKNSPSCGLQGVPVFGAGGQHEAEAAGLFAEALLTGLPGMPVAQEDGLNSAELREEFVERVREYHQRMSRKAD